MTPTPDPRQTSDEYEEPAVGPAGPSGVSPAPEPAPVTVTIDVDTSRYDAAVNSTISAVLRVELELEQARALLERAFTLRENGRPWDPAWQRWDTDTGQFLRSSSNYPAKGAPDGR